MSGRIDREKLKERKKQIDQAVLDEFNEMKLEVTFDENISEKIKYPKVKVIRKESIGLEIEAYKLACVEFEVEEPTKEMILCAKMSIMCEFDGKKLLTNEVAGYDTNFLHHIGFAYQRAQTG